jgi:CubicO group peptidase (beta-lactamase class C family)
LPDRSAEDVLALIDTWPVPRASAAILREGVVVATRGDANFVYRLASLSKMMTAWAVLIAVEEGITSLDEPVGPATVRHLLAHASGFGFDGDKPLMAPGRRRIYSNTGIETVAQHVAERADMRFADYLRDAVFTPLGMASSELRGSAAYNVFSTIHDTSAFVAELMRPRLVSPATAKEATTVQFAELGGVIPGLGSFTPNPWGLGVEIRGSKSPHWTGTTNSPMTFGHFGGSGTMAWVDPMIDTALVALTDRAFDEWAGDALRLWPEISDAAVAWAGA